jgi:hypothetical protein
MLGPKMPRAIPATITRFAASLPTALLAVSTLASSSGCRSERGAGPSAAASGTTPPLVGCVSEAARTKGHITSLAITPTGADLCLSAEGEGERCYTLAHDGARFTARPPSPPPSAARAATSARVRGEAKAVTVCGASGGCTTVAAEGFEGADRSRVDAKLAAQMPSDASPDGSRVFLVRHEGGAAMQIYGETYEVASSKKLARFELPFDGHVERVTWLGEHILVIGCVESGPGCSARLVHPLRGEVGVVDGNFFGIDGAVSPLGDGRYAYVTSGGRSVVVRNERGDMIKATEIAPGADDELGATARVLPGVRELVIAYGGPIGGDVVRVDLGAMKVVSRATPALCAR